MTSSSNESGGALKAIATFLETYLPSARHLVFLAIAVLLGNIVVLILSRSQRARLYRCAATSWAQLAAALTTRGRQRNSSASTPPRSLTPEKKVPNNGPPPAEYKDLFPPSSRDVMLKVAAAAEAAKSSSSSPPLKVIGAATRELNREDFVKNIIPLEADYRHCAAPSSTYTPMEISVAEIKALGDFPDYTTLSGVPLP